MKPYNHVIDLNCIFEYTLENKGISINNSKEYNHLKRKVVESVWDCDEVNEELDKMTDYFIDKFYKKEEK